MKNKKKTMIIISLTVIILLIITIALVYFFRPMTMNDIYDKPNFKGTITEVHEKFILVAVNANDPLYTSTSDLISVSKDFKFKDASTYFNVGDKVFVYYEGEILESYPAQINNAYAVITYQAEK